MRKLASVQKILEIIPIDGADRIELAKVLGWQCVVNKGQFKPMDMLTGEIITESVHRISRHWER